MKKLALALWLASSVARAEGSLVDGATAISSGHGDEAIARLEALANAGTVDANASFDRGLAYALRLTEAPKPGDFGQAIAAFEEAGALDDRLRDRAEHAADAVRGELAKKRSRENAPEAFDPSPTFTDRVLRLFPEGAWLALALVFCVAAAVGARRRGPARWLLQGGLLLALPCLAAAFTARSRALQEVRAVVVAEGARLLDEETRRPRTDQEPLACGALLRVVPGPTEVRVYAAGVRGILPRSTVRLLAR